MLSQPLKLRQQPRPLRLPPNRRPKRRKANNLFARAFIAVIGLTIAFSGKAHAQKVSIQKGNLVVSTASGESKTLTNSGHDSEPVLSPDGKWIAFVRTIPGKKISTGEGDAAATELWQIRADGKEPTALVRAKESDKMEMVLAGFSKPQFSTDGKLVYFLSEAWTTSGALHVVDTTNGKEHFVCPAAEFEVVPSGQYRDHLLVQQHRYFIGGGSFDWFWLLKPDGKEIGPVGDDMENFKATYLKE